MCRARIAAANATTAQTLEVLYHERSIGDVMEMTIAQAAEFFAANPKSRARFRCSSRPASAI